ncbi:coiled-coil domain-containing protein 178 isoform X2 [Lissotriton helveticus]
MPDVQLLHCCPKESDHQLHDDPLISRALAQLVCIGKEGKELQKPAHEAVSCKNKAMVLRHPSKRRSCALVNTPSPCVNKAIYHIEALEAKMKEWFEQYEDMLKEENASWLSYVSSDTFDDSVLSETSKELHVVGVGLIEPDSSRTEFLKYETEEVVSEVIRLIWRLEADRQEAEEALMQERQRKKMLYVKIDTLSLWKLQHLGSAVQKEHEACVRDISELQWHVSAKKQELQKALAEAQKLEAANAKLLEDLDFLEKHCPLLEEKLHLENQAMASIKRIQAEANVAYDEAKRLYEEAQLHFDKCTADANSERAIMSDNLVASKKMLQKRKNDIIQYDELYIKKCLALAETERQLEDIGNLFEDLLSQKSGKEEKELLWKGKVDDLKCSTDLQESNNKQLAAECTKLTEEVVITKEKCHSQILELEMEFHNKLHALRDLQGTVKELVIANEDLEQKTKYSVVRKAKLQAETIRMLKSIKKHEEQYLKTATDLDEVSSMHDVTKIKMEEMGDQASRDETRMKNLTEILKKQSADEIRATHLLEVRNSAILADLKSKQLESKRRRQELARMVADIENPLQALETSIHEMRQSHTDLMEKCATLLRRKQELEEEQKRMHGELGSTKCTLQLQLHHTQRKHSEVFDELDQTVKCTEKLHHGILELKSSKHALKKVRANTEETITDLKKDLECVQFKHQNAENLSCHLKSEIDRIRKQMQKERESHVLHLDCRQKALKKDKSVLDVDLIENRKLASKYKALQRIYLHKKDTLLDEFEKRVTLEASVRDRTQLSALQHRMHRALLEYFKLRGLYSQAGLATCQAASRENVQKILAVQEEMSKTIQQISAFVNSLTDGSSAEGFKANN